MKQSMSKTISKNTILGILFKILIVVLSFLNRTVFIQFLSSSYLGINGLYTSILSVLAMADLGINAVMIYVLYEPLVNGDYPRIASLVQLFKKLFTCIAGAIFLIGIILIPALPYLVSENTLSSVALIKYYLLFLSNTVLSYLGTYKATLLIADQKGYYVNAIALIANILRVVTQIGVLYVTHSYDAYLIAMLLSTVGNNLILIWAANKQYPILKQKYQLVDVSDVKPILREKTKAVFLYRVGGTLTDSTDNILISTLVGTVTVGYYSNYSVITTSVFSFLNVLSQAYMTGVGTFNVKAEKQEKKKVFYNMLLLYFFLGTLLLCGLATVTNDFMFLWLRHPEYILGKSFLLVIAIRVFFDVIQSTNWVFREALGMFQEAQNVRLWCAGLNLVLSVIFGKIWGLNGIIMATTLAKLLSTVWYEPKLICNKVFEESTGEYWKVYLKFILVAAISVVISLAASCWIDKRVSYTILRLVVKVFACVVIVLIMFVIMLDREEKYSDFMKNLKSKLIRKL